MGKDIKEVKRLVGNSARTGEQKNVLANCAVNLPVVAIDAQIPQHNEKQCDAPYIICSSTKLIYLLAKSNS